jgi:nitrate reductase gamma subunit
MTFTIPSRQSAVTVTQLRTKAIFALAAALLLLGLAGASHAAVGYGLFMVATLLICAGCGLLAVFALTRWFATDALHRAYAGAFWLGAWCYVLSLATFSGYFTHEALAGRIEWKLMVFGPAALAAIVLLDIGIWRVIVQRNLPTVGRFGDLWRRESLDQAALRRTLVNEVILHRTLFSVSPFRWVRHQLMFWGFGLMILVELGAVALREAFPAFGWTDIWHQPGHPLRLAFDFAYEFTGLMIVAGCAFALIFRVVAGQGVERKYADTPTVLFLLIVGLTGFLVEGARMALQAGAPGESVSFVGLAVAAVMRGVSPTWYDSLWIVHALAACALIAYIPFYRMIHICATPVGRIANSQAGLLAAKKLHAISGFFRGSSGKIGRG